jgi:hypothetical protein
MNAKLVFFHKIFKHFCFFEFLNYECLNAKLKLCNVVELCKKIIY